MSNGAPAGLRVRASWGIICGRNSRAIFKQSLEAAQGAGRRVLYGMERRIQSWHSPNLGMEMPIVAYGHAGNASAVFPLQRLGVEVWPVHTVQFSNHTGYGAWTGRVFDGQAPFRLIR